VATLIFFWNMLTGGYDDFNQIHHDPIINSYYLTTIKLPMAPFTLASSSLGLLLGACGITRLAPSHSVVDMTHGVLSPPHTNPQSFVPIRRTNDGTRHEKTGE
jgi:hypothetical protein